MFSNMKILLDYNTFDMILINVSSILYLQIVIKALHQTSISARSVQ